MESEPTYRGRVRARGLVSFRVVVKQTDLWIAAHRDLKREARAIVMNCRNQIETYIRSHPNFMASLVPLEPDPLAPPIVREMIRATKALGVGPMASVAGAIAEEVGKGLKRYTEQVIVENGGDIYLKAQRAVTVSIFAGTSPLSGKVGLKISQEEMPLGVCSSSGTVGHSFSRGIADAVCVLSPSAALADGAATALGNRIKGKRDLAKIADWAKAIEGILGGVAILGDRMAAWGRVKLVTL